MHWRAPTTMLAAFVAGIAFAVGHHFFYQSLHGNPVDNATFDQQINTGIGTAFAFLVRALLVIAVGVAFVQVLWQRLLDKAITIHRIDSMTQLQASLFDLFNFKTVRQHPLLAFIAAVSWTLPFAVIVPPATLAVQQSVVPQSTITQRDLPHLDFSRNLAFSNDYTMNRDPKYDTAPTNVVSQWFRGATDPLLQLSTITAFRAQIPQMLPPSPNSSFTKSFFGPALQCAPIGNDVIKEFDKVFGCTFFSPNSTGSNRCSFQYSYLSWVPHYADQVPFFRSNDSSTLDFTNNYNGGSVYGYSTIGNLNDEPAMLYIAAYYKQWSVLTCTLFNASYKADFEYRDGLQTMSTKRELLNSVPFEPQISSTINAAIEGWPPIGTVIPYASDEQISYYGVMDTFGRIMVGGIFNPINSKGGGQTVLSTNVKSTAIASALGNESITSMAKSAEQLFENITMTLFSDPGFTSVNASRFPATDVTLFVYPNVYNYTWRRLVLAYGLAILFATIAVAIGGYVFLRTDESYNYTFSTILRTTRDRDLDEIVPTSAMRGEDPLPDSMAKSVIQVGAKADIGGEHRIESVRVEQYQQVKRPVTTTYTAVRSETQDNAAQRFTIPRRPLNRGRVQQQQMNESRRSISPMSFEEERHQ